MTDPITRLEMDLLDAAERLHLHPRHARRHPGEHRHAGRRRRSRLPLTVGGLALLGAIVAVVLTLTAAGTNVTQAAFAVTENADGSVTLTLNEVVGISGANQALAKLGVRARIARHQPRCARTRGAIAPARLRGGVMQMVEPQPFGEGPTGALWVIHPGAIPVGYTLLLTGELVNDGRPIRSPHGHFIRAFAAGIGLYRDPPPTCELPSNSHTR